MTTLDDPLGVPRAAPDGRPDRLWPAALALALQALAILAAGWYFAARPPELDLQLYHRTATAVLRGAVPYRDLPLEYPPLALVPIVAPAAFGAGAPSPAAYVLRFAAFAALWSTAMGAVVVHVSRRFRLDPRVRAPALVFAALVILVVRFVPFRYDVFPALLTALGAAAFLAGSPFASGALLGVGVAAKLYPAVLVMLFATVLAARGRWPAAARHVAGAGVATVATVAPFVALAPTEILSFLRYHQLRGLQIESVAGGVVAELGALGIGPPVRVAFNYGAWHLASPAADAVLPAVPLVFVLLLGATLAACAWRHRADAANGVPLTASRLAADALAVLLVFIVANKVFSAQYVVWLIPFVPLLPWRYAAACVALFALTTFVAPYLYDRILGLAWKATLVLNARNALAVALVPALLRARIGAGGRSR